MRGSTTRVIDAATLARLRVPRADVVGERPGLAPDEFVLDDGPFTHYRRTLRVVPDAAGYRVTETFHYGIAAPLWWVLYAIPIRRALQRPLRQPDRPTKPPWWSPPDRLDTRASTVLALLCSLSVICGYLGTVITQTLTFASDEFGTSTAALGDTLAGVRVGIVLSMAIVTLADRHGRRHFAVVGSAVACVFTALGALAPNLWMLGATQTVARGITTAVAILLLVVAAEELPAGSRAYGLSVLALTAALGSGMAVWALPLADLGERGWRIIYVIPLAALPFLPFLARHLPETRRFEAAQHAAAGTRPHAAWAIDSRRLALFGLAGFLLLLFRTPASQLQNDFLRDERGYSGARISLFTVVTSTPAGIGVFLGGKLADARGRRGVGAVGLVGGVVCVVLGFLSHGTAMWLWTLAGVVIGSVTVPALGVYGPELFGTRERGRANGLVTVAGVAGSLAGLAVAGRLADRWGLGEALAVLAVGPIVVAGLLLTLFPETAHVELEALNPDDLSGDASGTPSTVP
jgi:MFS family permease